MKDISKIILASGSPRRRELLLQIGITPVVEPSGADENIDEKRPDKLVELLSERKCLDIAKKTDDGIVLGADTVVSLDGEILGKPRDEADAFKMIKKLQGNVHQVYTGVTLCSVKNGEITNKVSFSEKTDVTVSEMTDEEINAYIMTKEPMDKAGAYGIQGSFAKYISKIDGDYFNVVGLPLSAVYEELKKL